MARVAEVAADDVPPTTHAVPVVNVTRPDVVTPGLTREDALAGAPASEEERFRVPRILDEESAVSDLTRWTAGAICARPWRPAKCRPERSPTAHLERICGRLTTVHAFLHVDGDRVIGRLPRRLTLSVRGAKHWDRWRACRSR